ncbi:hypothetical protein Fmac_025827 [Flemingia macrophylla]|uniref:Uncharacterized protein n=1 Tax=Flemingia macrophylla TaxID=520843 RepID=A0ABD1LD44_9FABA
MEMAMASQSSVCTRPLAFRPFHNTRTPSSSSTFNIVRYKSHYQFQFNLKFQCNANGPPPPPVIVTQTDILRGSTRTVTTLLGTAALLLKAIPASVLNRSSSVSTAGALFFAALRDRPSGGLNTPLTVVAAGLGKWLDIYSGVLMVRVLLSWFPNIPWERQPLSAIRDLCDPYLNLFRNIIPPVFDTLDVSPLLAFAVLGTLGSILQTAL